MSKAIKEKKYSGFYSLRGYGRPLYSAIYNQRKVFNAPWFQGNREKDNYFEGWYFKNVSADGRHVWSFIPGVSLVKDNAHAFIQAINGQTGETYYYRYPLEEFSFSPDSFEVCVGKSFFSEKMILLDLDDGKTQIKGELRFDNITSYPSWYKRPGIMGWYRYMPFMECYHGVVSLDHIIGGNLTFNGELMIFEGGRGYIEKDWGSSMPKAWVWMQTNHFGNPGTSFMLSVARIPWVRNTFTGFLGFFLHEGKIMSFATYTGAKIADFRYTGTEVQISIKGKKYLIDIHATKSQRQGQKPGGLKAPVLGNMERVIHESIDAEIKLQILDKAGNAIFTGTGKHAGFEMVGEMKLLTQ